MFGDKEQRSGRKQEIEPTPGVEFVISDTDIGPDFDDLLRAILAKVLQYDHRLEPVMTITSTGDVQSRAVLEAYVHRVMGIKGVPIVPGEVTGRRLDEVKPHEAQQFDRAKAAAESEAFDQIKDNLTQAFIEKLQSLPNKSVTYLVTSTSTTLALLLRDEKTSALIKEKFKKVVFMGTVAIQDVDGIQQLVVPPDTSANFKMDPESGVYCVQELQKLGIRMDVVTKNATGEAYLEGEYLKSLADEITEGPHQEELREFARLLFEIPTKGLIGLWPRVNVPFSQRTEGAISKENDPAWFLRRFCKMNDEQISQLNLIDMQDVLPKRADEPAFGPNIDISTYIKATNPYDAVTELAVIEEYREKYFKPTAFAVNGVTHTIYDSLKQDINPETGKTFAEEFRALLKDLIIRSLKLAAEGK